MYEGAPNYPAEDRWWEIIERYGVTIFYTAPTAIRACMKWGREHPDGHDLSSLRLLGSVGEPINPRAWLWYREVIGGGRCPIVDTWWQTETGAIMITPAAGLDHDQAGLGDGALPRGRGQDLRLRGRGDQRRRRHAGADPSLALDGAHPLQGATSASSRPIGSATAATPTWSGDAARRDEDGYFWIVGRIDDVINVSGHRLSTMEVESTLVSQPARSPRRR